MNEKPVPGAEEEFGRRPAYFRIFAGEGYRAHVLQGLVEGVLCQVVVEKVLFQFNRRSIRVLGCGIAILGGKFLDVLDCRPLESIRHDGALFPELYDPEFNQKTWILPVHHERKESRDSEVVIAWEHRRPAVFRRVIVKEDHWPSRLDHSPEFLRIVPDGVPRGTEA